MKKQAQRIKWLSLTVLVMVGCSFSLIAAKSNPNIVIILADDLGWADVGFHGGPIATPNIDRIASEGMILDRFYVCPVCTPTRAGLMTGRYPIRFGLMKAVLPPWRNFALDGEEVLLPQILAKSGYRHRGIFGKWHLGHTHARDTPTRRGFTEFLGHYNGAIDYFSHEREGELDWHHNLESNYEQGYATDLIAGAAARFISEHANDGPFLCYVPFNAPHSPFQAKPEDIENYQALPELRNTGARKKIRPTYAAMVDSMDQGIGRILKAIDDADIKDQTLVWFLSDNGGTSTAGDNRPLRGQKGTVFEGGIRVPAAVRWPGRIPAGTKSTASLAWIDVLPTLMEVTGSSRDSISNPLDGINVLEVLTGKQSRLARDVFDYIGQAGEESEQICLITPQWKLVVRGPNIINDRLDASERERFLFRIDRDSNETNNLVEEYPDRVEQMFRRLVDFRSLQPASAVLAYGEGRQGFKAPKEWKVPDD